MKDIYEVLIRDLASLKNAEEVDSNGIDNFLLPKESKLPDKIKLGSLGDLSDFFRIAKDTLVHKAERDLWRINENNKGEVVIERLFNPDTNEPIRV